MTNLRLPPANRKQFHIELTCRQSEKLETPFGTAAVAELTTRWQQGRPNRTVGSQTRYKVQELVGIVVPFRNRSPVQYEADYRKRNSKLQRADVNETVCVFLGYGIHKICSCYEESQRLSTAVTPACEFCRRKRVKSPGEKTYGHVKQHFFSGILIVRLFQEK